MHVRPSTSLYILVKIKIDPCRGLKSDSSESFSSDESNYKAIFRFSQWCSWWSRSSGTQNYVNG